MRTEKITQWLSIESYGPATSYRLAEGYRRADIAVPITEEEARRALYMTAHYAWRPLAHDVFKMERVPASWPRAQKIVTDFQEGRRGNIAWHLFLAADLLDSLEQCLSFDEAGKHHQCTAMAICAADRFRELLSFLFWDAKKNVGRIGTHARQHAQAMRQAGLRQAIKANKVEREPAAVLAFRGQSELKGKARRSALQKARRDLKAIEKSR